MREAVAAGEKAPKPKAPALEAAAEEAKRAHEMAGELVLESGGAIAAQFTDEDVKAAIAEAKEQAAELVASIPEMVEILLAELAEAGRLGGEAQWCGPVARDAASRPRGGPRARRCVAPTGRGRPTRERAEGVRAGRARRARMEGRRAA